VPSHDEIPERYPVLDHAESRRRDRSAPWWNKRMGAGEVTICVLLVAVMAEWAYRPLF
jgi:hypothetical protein